jgi:hypothetical protein
MIWGNNQFVGVGSGGMIVTLSTKLAKPTLKSPANGAVNQPTIFSLSSGLSFSYDPAPWATSHELQYSPDSMFSIGVTGDLDSGTTYYWRMRAKDSIETGPWSDVWHFTTTPRNVGALAFTKPVLSPNVFISGSFVEYTITSASAVSIIVYDIKGRKVITSFNQHSISGKYTWRLPAGLSRGRYFLRLKAGNLIVDRHFIYINR